MTGRHGTEDAPHRPSFFSQVASDWQVVTLGEVTVEQTRRNNGGGMARDDIVSVDNVEGIVRSSRKLGSDFSRYKIVGHRDLAYNPMRLNVGSIALSSQNREVLVSPDYIVFRCNPNSYDPDFLDLFRRSNAWKAQINRSGQGSVRIRYYYHHIAQFFLPLPPLSEQRAIAAALRTVQRATPGSGTASRRR